MPTRSVHCIYNIQIALIFKRKRCHCEIALTGQNLYPPKQIHGYAPDNIINAIVCVLYRMLVDCSKFQKKQFNREWRWKDLTLLYLS